jgi:Skp family chaperone for outer membrane proteins
VSDTFVRQLMEMLRKGLKQHFSAEVGALHQQLETLQSQLQNRAGALAGGAATQLSPVNLNHSQIWRGMEDQLNMRLRYRGEMPKRGFFDRLREGRQGAMSFMMMIGMVGMIFGSTALRQHPLVGLILFCVFIGSIIFSFITWKKDDAERIDKELEKLRDGVVNEIHRLTAELQRDMQSKVTDQIEHTKRVWTEELDSLAETYGKERQRQSEAERQQVRDRLRVLEQQKRELAMSQGGIRQLRQKAGQLLQDCLRTLTSV